jgi:hypothetical protein
MSDFRALLQNWNLFLVQKYAIFIRNYYFSFPFLAVLNGVTDRVAGEATEYRVGPVAATPFTPSQKQKQ